MPVFFPPTPIGVSTGGNTAGNTGTRFNTFVFAGTDNITISQSTAANAPVTLWFSGPTPGAGGAVRFSAGTTSSDLATVVFSNSNNVSFGLNGSVITGTVTIATSLSNMRMSAGTTSNLLSAVTFADANNVSFGINASTITASASYAAQTNQTLGLYASSNTTGQSSSSTFDARTITFRGAGVASVGYSGGEVIISVPSGGGGLTNINVSAGTTSNNLSAITFANSNNITFGLDASTVTASFLEPYQSYYAALPQIGTTVSQTNGNSTSVVYPFHLPYNLSASYIRFLLQAGTNSTSFATTANTTFSASILSTVNFHIYSRNTGASSQSLAYVTSGSAGFSSRWSLQANANGSQYTVSYQLSFPWAGTTTSYSTSVAVSNASFQLSSNSLTGFTNLRFMDLPLGGSLSAGQYWLMLGASSTTSTQGTAGMTGLRVTYSTIAGFQMNQVIGFMGSAQNASYQILSGVGSFSTAAGATTSSLGFSNVSSSASHPLGVFWIIRHT